MAEYSIRKAKELRNRVFRMIPGKEVNTYQIWVTMLSRVPCEPDMFIMVENDGAIKIQGMVKRTIDSVIPEWGNDDTSTKLASSLMLDLAQPACMIKMGHPKKPVPMSSRWDYWRFYAMVREFFGDVPEVAKADMMRRAKAKPKTKAKAKAKKTAKTEVEPEEGGAGEETQSNFIVWCYGSVYLTSLKPSMDAYVIRDHKGPPPRVCCYICDTRFEQKDVAEHNEDPDEGYAICTVCRAKAGVCDEGDCKNRRTAGYGNLFTTHCWEHRGEEWDKSANNPLRTPVPPPPPPPSPLKDEGHKAPVVPSKNDTKSTSSSSSSDAKRPPLLRCKRPRCETVISTKKEIEDSCCMECMDEAPVCEDCRHNKIFFSQRGYWETKCRDCSKFA
jgi:hypothetical protein